MIDKLFKKWDEIKEESEAIDKLKSKYLQWDEWTGARFNRVENPNYVHGLKDNASPDAVLRVNPVTGEWNPLNEFTNEET